MKGINVNPRRDFISARYGQFASTSVNKSSSGAGRSSKTSSGFRRPNHDGHESNNDFMSKLKDSTPGNVYIPSNGAESIDINNYIENLLM